LSRRLAEPGLTRERLINLGSQVVLGRTGGDLDVRSGPDSVSLLETLIGEAVVEVARRTLAGYPFSIGCVFAFYLLKRTELRNLNTAFAGTWLGVGGAEVSDRLQGMR
jgi:hypothetical protein